MFAVVGLSDILVVTIHPSSGSRMRDTKLAISNDNQNVNQCDTGQYR